jgi:hypothetical protein
MASASRRAWKVSSVVIVKPRNSNPAQLAVTPIDFSVLSPYVIVN